MNAIPEGCVAVRYRVQFTRGRKGQKRLCAAPPPPERPTINPSTVPRITRMLVLGHHFERLVRDGVVKDYAKVARLTGLSKARVTQLVNLMLLAPDIQEAILLIGKSGSTATSLHEAGLRRVVTASEWTVQLCLSGNDRRRA